MKIKTEDSPMTILGVVLTVVGMILYLVWMSSIGIGIMIGSYIKVELEPKEVK